MEYPKIPEEVLLRRLEAPGGILRMVLDTDTFNEIDDQFAVAYALLSPERLKVEALYAAPYVGHQAGSPGEGMENSYAEILRLLERLGQPAQGLAHLGSTAWLAGRATPERSPAALDLVERAMASPEESPLYVVAIGAITNVASAIRIEPEIVRRIVVVWLGGQPHHFHTAAEYNLQQDPAASQTVFDCGVPLVYIPCWGVSSHLLTTVPELEGALKGRNPISDFLLERFKAYEPDHFAWAKEIWDIAGIAYLLDETWVPTQVIPSPILNGDLTWGQPPAGRHVVREAWYVRRNPIFRDLFLKLQNFTAT
jgi:inosine-uridine nucleoside N-ribohydrolase